MDFRRSVKSLVAVVCSATLGSAFADRFATTGAVVTQVDDAEVYAWTSTNEVGTIVVPDGGALFDILLVGGGGAGGFCRGGGGGGGGVLYQTGVFLEAGTYYIKVGAGGEPDWWSSGSYDAPASTEKTDGRPSTLSNATEQVKIAYGGGGGASFKGGVGRAGGSSGGCAYKNTVAPEGVVGQGNRGGATHVTSDYYSAGGGGGGGPGAAATTSSAGSGGDGFLCIISGTNAWYGAGGGGGAYSGSNSGAGGLGGGGHGGYGTNTDLTPGADGVGAGGGGASGASNNRSNCGGKRGGNGIVIFRTAAASKPDFTEVMVTVSDATNVTFSAALSGMGTDPLGSAAAKGCDLYFAYGTDSNNLVSVKVKSGWSLTESQWSMTVCDIPKYSKFYYRAALTNDLGVGAEVERSGFNMTTGQGQSLPVKFGYSDPGFVLYSGGISYNYYDIVAWFDGNVGRTCDLLRKISPSVLLDAGEPKTVRMFRAYSELAAVEANLANFEFYGSNDKSSWTKLADINSFVFAITNNTWLNAITAPVAAFRYYELRGIPDLKLAEVELIAEDMALSFNRSTYYVKSGNAEALDAAYDPDGVTISGKLTMGPSGTEIYGYVADADYDGDESAWKANGRKFMINGTFSTGGTFSQKVKFSGRGRRYLRLFAKNGGNVASSQRSREIVLKANTRIVPAYVNSQNDGNFSKVYDGDLNTWKDQGTQSYIIFDLRKLASNESLSLLKLWPVLGQYNVFTWTRTRSGKVHVSYDDVELTPTGSTLVPGREVYALDTAPSINWTCVKPYLDDMDSPLQYTEYIYPDLPRSPRPTYLKIDNFAYNNCKEIELRVSTPPKGLSIIFR